MVSNRGRRSAVAPLVALCALLAGFGGRARAESAAVYVVNVGSNDVSVIDPAARAVVATVPVGVQPNGVAVTPDGRRVYITNFRDDTVSVIDAAAGAVIDTLAVEAGPVGVAVAPDGARVYVTNRTGNTVSIIDVAAQAVIGSVAGVGPSSNGIAITPDGASALVNNATSAPGTLSVVDLDSQTVTGAIEVYQGPKRVAIAPDGGGAFVAHFRSWNISIVDLATGLFQSALRVGGRTVGVAVHPNGQYAYVTNLTGVVEVLETSNLLLTAPIAVGGEPYAIALSGQGGEAYVANLADDTVSVVDLASDREVTTIPVGDKPFAIAWGCSGEGCDRPPFTPKPTGTTTMSPTISATPTITPTAAPSATPTSDPNAVRLVVSADAGRPGERVEMRVRLESSGQQVAGVQLDIGFAAQAPIAAVDGGPDCTVNPAIRKNLSSNFQPVSCGGGECRAARFLVLSLSDVGQIPDGLLFTCRVAIDAGAPPGSYALTTSLTGASDPRGIALATRGVASVVLVTATNAAQRVQAATIATRRCSAGAADGAACGSAAECPDGVCVIPGTVCDGGADDGLLCACPGGSCGGPGSCAGGGGQGTCEGGRADGACCDLDFQCAGGSPCTDTARSCVAGVAKGLPCLRDAHCPGSTCRSSGRACAGGQFDGYACVDVQDCPQGACSAAGSTPTPTQTSAAPVATATLVRVAAGGSSGGCTIAPSGGSASAWLFMVPLALALLRRRSGRA